MDHTHYWEINRDLPRAIWDQITDDARRLIAAAPVRVAYDWDRWQEPPRIDDITIRFNAAHEEDAHETFVLSRATTRFDFCKTNRKPYDLLVCAILAVAEDHAGGDIIVRSDGSREEWTVPVNWARTILQRPIPIPKEVGE